MWFLVEDDDDFEKTHASWPLDDFIWNLKRDSLYVFIQDGSWRKRPHGWSYSPLLSKQFPGNFVLWIFCLSNIFLPRRSSLPLRRESWCSTDHVCVTSQPANFLWQPWWALITGRPRWSKEWYLIISCVAICKSFSTAHSAFHFRHISRVSSSSTISIFYFHIHNNSGKVRDGKGPALGLFQPGQQVLMLYAHFHHPEG